jgi:hypothetical protein
LNKFIAKDYMKIVNPNGLIEDDLNEKYRKGDLYSRVIPREGRPGAFIKPNNYNPYR